MSEGSVRAGELPAEVLQSSEPVLLRGLVQDWPLVRAARESDAAFCEYLRPFGPETRLMYQRGPAEIQGRPFYNDDFTGFNFRQDIRTLGALLDELLVGTPETIYLSSTEIQRSFPGLGSANALPALASRNPLVSLWLGNRMQVAAHFDTPDNIACVVAGRRRFTLFPPDQVANLYIGPFDLTPAGQAISLVDHARPDLQRFPRYEQALAAAQVFELLPGDALFIPSQWWHAVESLEPINALVNFWWRQSPAFMDPPISTLLMAMLTLRDLPPAQRDAWRSLFDHYIFEADEHTSEHIPPNARGTLAPLTDGRARQLRAELRNRLNR